MVTWNDIDILAARGAVDVLRQGDVIEAMDWLKADEFLVKFLNNLELLKQKEIKVCRILQKP